MPDIQYVSPEALIALKAEYKQLTVFERVTIAERISTAAAFGDLSENAEYEDAKREQAFLEGRIASIANLIANGVVIKDPKSNDTVQVGSTVTIKSEHGEETFTIVGSHETRPASGGISNNSPIARAMLKRSVGERVTAIIPSGQFEFEIRKIA